MHYLAAQHYLTHCEELYRRLCREQTRHLRAGACVKAIRKKLCWLGREIMGSRQLIRSMEAGIAN